MHWDAAKDKALRNLILSDSIKGVNWEDMSARFDVPLHFLLQQAAWLHERHFENVRAEMKKLGVSGTATPNPQMAQGEAERGAVNGGVGMVRTGSKGTSS